WYGTHASMWVAFAMACAKLDYRDGLSQILVTAAREPDNTFRATALSGLARAWGMIGDQSGIAVLAKLACRLDRAFVSPAKVLVEVAAGALEGNHRGLARRYAVELVEQFQTAPDDAEMRVRLHRDIAAALVDVDRKDVAAAICHEGVSLTTGF